MGDVDLVIFDCDGVLADSEVISADILIAELAHHGVKIDRAHVFLNFVGKSFPGVAKIIRETFQVGLPPDFEARYRAALLAAYATKLRPTAGFATMLSALACRYCVATSSSPARVRRTLDLCGLSDHFGADVFTASQVEHGKPAPDLFLFAARQMNTAPERCLVIEDSLPGVAAARAAKMTVWRFIGGAHFAAQDRAQLGTPDGVVVFDSWADFYEIAPDLRQRNPSNG